LNILSNAIKYTPLNGRITMKVREIPSDKNDYSFYETTISDTGIGMSKEFLPHIYDAFSREDSSRNRGILGTGLGMPIVKKLVEEMNGTISVESELGVGTTFVVIIPHRIASKKDIEGTSKKLAEVDVRDFKGKRILLVEDNDLNSEIAITILEEFGFIVEHAKDGLESVLIMENAPEGYFDAILMDIQMPRMNGYEATSRIRAFKNPKSKIPIIAMTANAFVEDVTKCLKVGMNNHIAKPIQIPDLLAILSENLKN